MELTYTSRHDHADATTFIFAPAKDLTWIAGQSIKIELVGAYEPIDHRFTISSAPYEGSIAITTRQSQSAFKKKLFALKEGDQVRAFGLEGMFVWQDFELPKFFAAVGIGITPFFSMLKQRSQEKLPLKTKLIYSSKDDLFVPDFKNLAATHPEFSFTPIKRRLQINDFPKNHQIYLSGPSLMVDEISAELLKNGFAESQLVRDWFTGIL